MALDAALEHGLPEVLQVAGEIRTVEDSFDRFARWCDTDATCALQGKDVGAVFDAAQIQGSHVLTREGDGHTSYYTSQRAPRSCCPAVRPSRVRGGLDRGPRVVRRRP
ncbi:hypothetical protein, partial [Cellulomonas chitinilytica]|uniref:hypothetical protein n=1 Tax=Cellulomonas chitinilytica TaxID=398759 RepID=UPI00402BF30A